MNITKIKRAIISVSDKIGLIGFAQGLSDCDVELFSTGGTRRFLEAAGIATHDIATYTEFPEMMDGRVKTLHPKVFGGILCRRDVPEDVSAARRHGIELFDLVVVNLYPFEATVRRGAEESEATEQIDVGGPSLVRAAAKNYRFVSVATSAQQYAEILEAVRQQGGTTDDLRRRLMVAAFEHTALYDQTIWQHFASAGETGRFPPAQQLSLRRKLQLRYGENEHQAAALYAIDSLPKACVAWARKLHGKELSYNNILDFDAGLGACAELRRTGMRRDQAQQSLRCGRRR